MVGSPVGPLSGECLDPKPGIYTDQRRARRTIVVWRLQIEACGGGLLDEASIAERAAREIASVATHLSTMVVSGD